MVDAIASVIALDHMVSDYVMLLSQKFFFQFRLLQALIYVKKNFYRFDKSTVEKILARNITRPF